VAPAGGPDFGQFQVVDWDSGQDVGIDKEEFGWEGSLYSASERFFRQQALLAEKVTEIK
jgi:hypothetical protein